MSNTQPNNDEKVRNLTIIGSGPAGWTAAIYAARDQLDPLVITGKEPGGQLMITTTIENFPGFEEPIGGSELMERMRKQALSYGTEVLEAHVTEVDFSQRPLVLKTNNGDIIRTKSVIISTGSYAKWLGLESETNFKGYGVSGCAVCDGFFFKGKKVCVVGGGNTAIEEALHLCKFATEVTLLVRSDALKGEMIMRKQLESESKIKVLYNVETQEILGTQEETKSVTGVKIKNRLTGEVSQLDLDGVFIAIGHAPNSSIFKGSIEMDDYGYIKTAPDSTKTNLAGVFAAGDVRDPKYKQAVTAAGSGCMAALEVAEYLSSQK